jgi:hypothetical protein
MPPRSGSTHQAVDEQGVGARRDEAAGEVGPAEPEATRDEHSFALQDIESMAWHVARRRGAAAADGALLPACSSRSSEAWPARGDHGE